eukprot:939607_1
MAQSKRPVVTYSDDDSYEDEESQPLVIDNGGAMMRIGFGGDDAPRAVFPTIIGRKRHDPSIFYGHMRPESPFVGDEAQSKRQNLNIKRPMFYGHIDTWDAMEHIWHHSFYNELRVCPEEHSVLLTEKALDSNLSRQKITQIMFETFIVHSLYIAYDHVLSLYSH